MMNPRIPVIAVVMGLWLLLTVFPEHSLAQEDPTYSTSPNPTFSDTASVAGTTAPDEAAGVISFSEYPVDTGISVQYARHGILFSGDSPYITTDRSNPTSPVLSGNPLFRGDIVGTFVSQTDGTTPVIVESFTLDAGYFDELASTRIEWFDPNGEKLGQRTNSIYGIERFVISGGNIASWRISIIKTEPYGYAIDNVSFQPVQASVLFRELYTEKKDGSWGESKDKIPGFDHVGLHVDNIVYESHPGYGAEGDEEGDQNVFTSEDGSESVTITKHWGVQAQHTKGTFQYDKLLSAAESPVTRFEEIPIGSVLADRMRAKIQEQIDAGAEFLNPSFTLGGLAILRPSAQKGSLGSFTCVGLVEWAAEQAGYKGGEGFVRNTFESYPVIKLKFGFLGSPTTIPFVEVPFLFPETMNWFMKHPDDWDTINQWFQGMFDPVDFMITDPLGRKLGYTEMTGERNEIPNAFYSGDGSMEQFFVPHPVAGEYQVEFVGLGEHAFGAMVSKTNGRGINRDLAMGEVLTTTIDVEMQVGVPGDVNFDGCVDTADSAALSKQINTFPFGPADPKDIDGNGIIEQADVDLLARLVALEVPCPGIFMPMISSAPSSPCEVGSYYPWDVAFVLDRSRTAWESFLTDAAKKGTRAFLAKMDLAPEQAAVLSFSANVAVDQALTTDEALVNAALDRLRKDAGSAIGDAIVAAKNELTSGRHLGTNQQVIILYTDGEVTSGQDAIAAAQQAKQAGIRIIAVGIGANVYQDVMRSIASSPGDFYYVPNRDDVPAIMSSVADKLRCGQ